MRTLSFLAICLCCMSAPAARADAPLPAPAPITVATAAPPTWDQKLAGQFVIRLAQDKRGCIWAGTEERGVWRYDPRAADPAQAWTQFTTKDGLGDDNGYALACDQQGRVWVGTLNHGVSVYNGKTWKTYDQVTGPLGGHVVAIAVSPKNGDVWMATEVGLARYRVKADDWKYYVSPPGVRLSNATGLAFDRAGNLIVALQTDGIAIGDASADFERWTHLLGPEGFAPTPTGNGLPSKQVNCLFATSDGRIWAGTHDGLAVSANSGQDWQYVRGADYTAKWSGLYANKKFQPSLCGFQLMVADSDGSAIDNGHYIAVVASQSPQDQLGAHITCSGGSTRATQSVIDVSHVVYPAPIYLYQSERQGEFTYTVSKLVPGRAYVLRLHFAELDYNGPGQRKFSVIVNDAVAFKDLDVFQEAGGANIALIKPVPAVADATGKVTIRLTGRPDAPAAVPANSGGEGAFLSDRLMAEDYVTTLAEGASGNVIVGHSTRGAEQYDRFTRSFAPLADESDSMALDAKGKPKGRADFIASLLSLANGNVLLGTYGLGLRIAGSAVNAPFAPSLSPSGVAFPVAESPFPSPAKPPTADEIAAIDAIAADDKLADLKPGEGAYLGADWATRGDWVGRYGSRLAILCAAGAPFNHEIINDWTYKYDYDLGPNRQPGDSVRHWIHWLRTEDPRVLWDPVIGARRESEWDDHGEAYSWSQEGPDLWVGVSVPAGAHRISAYFVNKDGHDGANRTRDYLMELLPWRSDVRDAAILKPFASVRIREFWGGEYHSFVVAGPAKFYLHVSRNNSFNTILPAIMIDKLTGPPTPLEGVQCTYCKTAQYASYMASPIVTGNVDPRATAIDPLRKLWLDIDLAACKRKLTSQLVANRVYCYRSLSATANRSADKTPYTQMMAWWRRKLPLVTDEDRKTFLPAMRSIYAAETVAYPQIKNIH
ncbi:MAG TPA: two-component regulator propeller domain-containing protein [Capsulimonadaceae bacterium]|jgi:hypothetical protein